MPISVTDKITAIIAGRDAGIISTQESVIKLLAEVRRQILAELIDAPGDSFTAYRLQQSLAGIQQHLTAFETAAQRSIGSGLTAAWEAGEDLLPEAATTAGVQVNFYRLSTATLDALKEFTFGKISGVTGDLYNKIRGELSLGVLGEKTPAEVAASLAGKLEGRPMPKKQDQYGNWHPAFKSVAERAEVITATEMGRAFSLATTRSMEQAAPLLPGMRKVWLHAGHPKIGRIIHVHLHGTDRELKKPFYQAPNGYGVQFPRDPNAPISEVIRCGCTHIPWLPAFGELKTFVSSFDRIQNDLWTGKKAA
jgi:hypothetical protein